jgi:hypothetical protein
MNWKVSSIAIKNKIIKILNKKAYKMMKLKIKIYLTRKN